MSWPQRITTSKENVPLRVGIENNLVRFATGEPGSEDVVLYFDAQHALRIGSEMRRMAQMLIRDHTDKDEP